MNIFEGCPSQIFVPIDIIDIFFNSLIKPRYIMETIILSI